MTKKLLIAILAAGMMFHVSGCSSSGTQEEGDVAMANDEAFAEEGEGDFAEESSDGGAGDVASADDEGADGGDELSLDDGQSVADNGSGDDLTLDSEGGDELALEDGGGGDDLALEGDDGLPDDVAQSSPPVVAETPPATNEPPLSDEPIFGSEGGTDVAGGSDMGSLPEETHTDDSTSVASTGGSDVGSSAMPSAAPAPGAFLPLLKIKDTAFTKNGTLLNRVYLGRPGDTVKSVSNKLYGAPDRASDLKKWNGFLSRGVKTGDKIYYSSPRDPNDTRMLTFYEDVGAQPSVYVSKDGDNIRRVSKDLLGNSDSWKEIWATNLNVDSKGDIPAGIELRYWPEGVEAGAPILAGGGAPTAPVEHPPVDMAQAPPPPPEPSIDPMAPPDLAMNDPLGPGGPGPASTPDLGAAAGTMEAPNESLAPPPPPPPEPPAPPKPKKAPPVEVATGSDPDTMMAMAFGGILLIAAAVLFVVIRKNRAKRMDLGQTQV